MSLKFHLPHYFSFHLRRQVKELYAATAIADIALSAMLIFEPIYLYQAAGLSVEKILLFFAAVYAWYVILIPLGGKVAAKFGFKHAMIASIPFQLGYWACLFFATKEPGLLYLAAFLYGLEKSFYWPAFHSVVAKFARDGQVGREFSVLTVIIQFAHVLGPLLGGIIAVKSGSGSLLVISGIIYALVVIPLIKHREKPERQAYQFRDSLELYRTQTRRAVGYFGFGEELLAFTVWPIFIFGILKGYDEVGLLTTIASGLAIIISLWIGKLTDGHDKQRLIRLGGILSGLGWFIRPLLPGSNGVLASDTFGRTAKNVVFIPLCTVTYERAESSDILPYVVFFEQSLAIGKLLTALLAAALFALTGSFAVLFVVAGILSLLYMLL